MERLDRKASKLVAGTLVGGALMLSGLVCFSSAVSQTPLPGEGSRTQATRSRDSKGSEAWLVGERSKQAIASNRERVAADKRLTRTLTATGWRQTGRAPDNAVIDLFLYPNHVAVVYSSRPSGLWFVVDRGTWRVSDGKLSLESDGTALPKGRSPTVSRDLAKISSQGELSFLDKTWRPIKPPTNRSEQQLVGTWAIRALERKQGNRYGFAFKNPPPSKRIELYPDGTWRRKTLTWAHLGVRRLLESGTWTYDNCGLYDGVLILKNSQGQTVSIGAIAWSSDGTQFTHINRAERDRETGKLKDMGRQAFVPTKS